MSGEEANGHAPPLHDQLNSHTAAILLMTKMRQIPINIVFVGAPHVGKKHMAKFASKYLGADHISDLVSPETQNFLVSVKTRRNECNPFTPEQAVRDLRLGLDQKTVLFNRQHIMSLDRTRAQQEEELAEMIQRLAMPDKERAKAFAEKDAQVKSAEAAAKSSPPSVRPCPNVRLFLGSTITDLFGRAQALWAHKMIPREEYMLFRSTVNRLNWQIENLACPSHQTLYVYLQPEENIYALKVYSYFQNILSNRFPVVVRGDEKLLEEYGRRYLAFCMEVNSNLAKLFQEGDMISRFFTVTVRFENDICGVDLVSKLTCDVIMKHIGGLIESKVWTNATRSPLKTNLKEFLHRIDQNIFTSLERVYTIPKIRLTDKVALHSNGKTEGKAVPVSAVRASPSGSMIGAREIPSLYSNAPPPTATAIELDKVKLTEKRKSNSSSGDLGDDESEFLANSDDDDGGMSLVKRGSAKSAVVSVILDHNKSAEKRQAQPPKTPPPPPAPERMDTIEL